jgi:hypothetical protein
VVNNIFLSGKFVPDSPQGQDCVKKRITPPRASKHRCITAWRCLPTHHRMTDLDGSVYLRPATSTPRSKTPKGRLLPPHDQGRRYVRRMRASSVDVVLANPTIFAAAIYQPLHVRRRAPCQREPLGSWSLAALGVLVFLLSPNLVGARFGQEPHYV